MAEGKLKRFLFPTEDEHLSDMVENERSSYSSRGSNLPDVEESDDLHNFDVAPRARLERDIGRSNASGKGPISEAGVYAPNTFEDAEKIAKELIAGRTVIVNLENLLRNDQTKQSATRVIDFLCGVSYALKVDVKRINNSTFIFAPQTEEVRPSLHDEIRFGQQ